MKLLSDIFPYIFFVGPWYERLIKIFSFILVLFILNLGIYSLGLFGQIPILTKLTMLTTPNVIEKPLLRLAVKKNKIETIIKNKNSLQWNIELLSLAITNDNKELFDSLLDATDELAKNYAVERALEINKFSYLLPLLEHKIFLNDDILLKLFQYDRFEEIDYIANNYNYNIQSISNFHFYYENALINQNPLASKLFSFGYQIGGHYDYNVHPILTFVKHNNILAVKRLLRQNEFGINDLYSGTTLLNYAISNNPSLIKTLIKMGADVSKPDNSGKTPLMKAIEVNNDKVTDIIIAYSSQSEKDFALDYAIQSNNENILRLLNGGAFSEKAFDYFWNSNSTFLMNKLNKNSPKRFSAIITNESTDFFKELLLYKDLDMLNLITNRKLSFRDFDGNTIVHMAALFDISFDKIEILLKKNKDDVFVRNNNGQFPFDLAHSDIVKNILFF